MLCAHEANAAMFVNQTKHGINALLVPVTAVFSQSSHALDVFVTCAQERTLRLIAMDEAHVHVQHGTSFCDDICVLRVEFFRRMYGNQPSN